METITPYDFEGFKLKKKSPAIVLFYMEWCPYCKSVLPTLDAYSKKGGKVYIMEGETGNNKVIFDRYSIRPVPDIRVLNGDGSLSERYDGERELTDFETLVPIHKETKEKKPKEAKEAKKAKKGKKRRNKSQKGGRNRGKRRTKRKPRKQRKQKRTKNKGE